VPRSTAASHLCWSRSRWCIRRLISWRSSFSLRLIRFLWVSGRGESVRLWSCRIKREAQEVEHLRPRPALAPTVFFSKPSSTTTGFSGSHDFCARVMWSPTPAAQNLLAFSAGPGVPSTFGSSLGDRDDPLRGPIHPAHLLSTLGPAVTGSDPRLLTRRLAKTTSAELHPLDIMRHLLTHFKSRTRNHR